MAGQTQTSETIQIRFAVPGDSENISKVLRLAFAEFEPVYTPKAFAYTTPPAEVIRKRFDEDGAIWVAEVEEKILGTVSCIPENGDLYIRSMAVLPEAQGSGLGGKLLGLVEGYALEHGFTKMFLYTTHTLKGAIRLYERFGFEKVRDIPSEEFFGTSGLEMEKKLNLSN